MFNYNSSRKRYRNVTGFILCNLFHKLSGAVFGVANCSISSSSLTVIVEVFRSGLKCYQSDVFTTDSLCRNIWGHRIYFDLISCDQSYFSLSVNIFLKTRLSFLFRRVFFAKSSFLIFPQIQNISTQIGMANHLSKIWRYYIPYVDNKRKKYIAYGFISQM